MTQDIDYVLRNKAREVANGLIDLKHRNPVAYFELRSQLIKDLGEEFYNQHIAWHEEK